jgi:hypothetical protein
VQRSDFWVCDDDAMNGMMNCLLTKHKLVNFNTFDINVFQKLCKAISVSMIEGFLNKKGRGKTLSFRRPWSIRFFVLDPDAMEIRYYSGNGPAMYVPNLLGFLNLTIT